MPVTVIVGAQWGDEGKGKIVDHLSEEIDVVARYQGGANAGHPGGTRGGAPALAPPPPCVGSPTIPASSCPTTSSWSRCAGDRRRGSARRDGGSGPPTSTSSCGQGSGSSTFSTATSSPRK